MLLTSSILLSYFQKRKIKNKINKKALLDGELSLSKWIWGDKK